MTMLPVQTPNGLGFQKFSDYPLVMVKGAACSRHTPIAAKVQLEE
jgi:hypothetical protein